MLWLPAVRVVTHSGLHFGAPAALAWLLFGDRWKAAWAIVVATMLAHADHLLADPLFDPEVTLASWSVDARKPG